MRHDVVNVCCRCDEPAALALDAQRMQPQVHRSLSPPPSTVPARRRCTATLLVLFGYDDRVPLTSP